MIAFDEARKTGGQPLTSMYKLRTLVYLREVGFRNCVQGHPWDCCVFTLRHRGVHFIKEPIAEDKRNSARQPRISRRGLGLFIEVTQGVHGFRTHSPRMLSVGE